MGDADQRTDEWNVRVPPRGPDNIFIWEIFHKIENWIKQQILAFFIRMRFLCAKNATPKCAKRLNTQLNPINNSR